MWVPSLNTGTLASTRWTILGVGGNVLKGTQAWNFFFDFFCRNRNHMVPRACKNRIQIGRNIRLLNISAHAQHAMKSVPSMLSMRWNRFLVCSACDEIRSAYAQSAIKFFPRLLSIDCTCKTVHILPLAEHARKFVPRMLSVRWNRFLVCSACDKIVSAYAQHAHKIIFENDSKIPN